MAQIHIQDKWLKFALEEHFGGEITLEGLKKMKELDWSEYRAEAGMAWGTIDSLEGLEQATSLTRLSLDGNHIQDLTPLTDMIKMEEIWLYDNDVRSVEHLKNMKKLKTLLLDSNRRLDDISVLKECVALEYLNISNTSVKDIAVLTNLPNLKKLGLYRTPIDTSKDDNFETLRLLYQKGVEIRQ